MPLKLSLYLFIIQYMHGYTTTLSYTWPLPCPHNPPPTLEAEEESSVEA